MRCNLPPVPDQPDDRSSGGVGPSSDGAAELSALADVAGAYHRLMRQALTAVVAADQAPVSAETGLTPGLVLELDHRLPVPVVRQLEAVATRLAAMPDTAEVFARGVIEFDDLAGIVRAGRELSGPALAELDEWAACRAVDLAAEQLLHVLVDDVAARAEQLRAPGWARRQERRAEAGQEVTFQGDFDGGGLMIASLDAIGYPAVRGAVETVAGPPIPGRGRAGQRAAALVAVCDHAMAGTGPLACSPRSDADRHSESAGRADDVDEVRTRPARGEVRIPTRPRARISLIIDLAQTTPERFALLQRTSGLRAAPTLSARAVDALAAEAELLVQVADGRRPLAELRAEDIPAAVRRAVIARDRGCRAPGCARPASECDIHHIVPRREDGPHDVDNLALLCRGNHVGVDTDSWQMSLAPTTGTITWRHPRSRRTYRTVPHGSRPPPRHPDDVPLAEWQAPPIPAVPRDEDAPPPTSGPPFDDSS